MRGEYKFYDFGTTQFPRAGTPLSYFYRHKLSYVGEAATFGISYRF